MLTLSLPVSQSRPNERPGTKPLAPRFQCSWSHCSKWSVNHFQPVWMRMVSKSERATERSIKDIYTISALSLYPYQLAETPSNSRNKNWYSPQYPPNLHQSPNALLCHTENTLSYKGFPPIKSLHLLTSAGIPSFFGNFSLMHCAKRTAVYHTTFVSKT